MDIQPHYLTLDQLLKNRLFRIPNYQRAYSWEKKQRNDMFADIQELRNKKDSFHFMATFVGLRRETKTIVTDEYHVIEVVDGQQRLTTLIMLLKAIEKKLNRELTQENKLSGELRELLVKQNNLSLILLQTNHDKSHYFTNYIRDGKFSDPSEAKTLANRELLSAIEQCESFVEDFENRIELLRIIKNQLKFIFHEINDESAVYTVFEVLNNRGLRVSWIDRLKSMLMAIAFEHSKGNAEEHIKELHQTWAKIYETIGLRQGMNSEALQFAATLKAPRQISKPLGEEAAVETFVNLCENDVAKVIAASKWLLTVTEAADRFFANDVHSRAVTRISHTRLLAISIILKKFSDTDEVKLLDLWEKTAFRVFSLCGNDARTAVGDYVRLAWDITNTKLDAGDVINRINNISEGKEHTIEWAVAGLENENCYEGWEEELRYLFFRYEEYLSRQQNQKFNNEQWNRIWEASASKSIEHIYPQSQGSQKRLPSGQAGIFVHRLGNLMLLPPGLNSTLSDQNPSDKAESYLKTGLFSAIEVANIIKKEGWGQKQVENREQKILQWIKKTWG